MEMKKIIVFLQMLCLSYIGIHAQKLFTDVRMIREYTWGGATRDYKPKSITIGIDESGKGRYVYEYDDNKTEIWHEDEIAKFRPQITWYNIPKEEYDALMDLYNATGGANWTHNEGWGTDLPIDQWYGIGLFTSLFSFQNDTCEAHVDQISLRDNNLIGTLPASLSELKHLWIFLIQNNHLSGEFPERPLSDIMDKVNIFHIYGNDFNKTIPEWTQNHEKFKLFWPEFIYQRGNNASIFEKVHIPAPDINFKDFNGNRHTSPKEFSNNKLTIITEWATWCPFTPRLNSKLIPAYNKYHDFGLNIIGLTRLDERNKKEDVDKYIKENGILWPNVPKIYDENENYIPENELACFKWWGTSIPSVFAIDSRGEVVFQSYLYNDYFDVIRIIEDMFGPIDPIDYYTSTDYSHDGEVRQLQQATVGKGIDIVFMGEAFVDKDMEPGGKYEQKMNNALEQFFVYEPYKSLRNRFNVYEVKVVSPNDVLAEDAKTAFNTTDEIFEYAQKAVGVDADQMMVCVFYNTEVSFGRSHTNMYSDGSFIAFLKDPVGSVLNHEVGHGFGLLKDEYVEGNNQDLAMPEERRKEMDEQYEKYGWGANVDWRNDVSTVRWAKFLNDTRYADTGLGLFEGSGLYGYGVYRPTENSMMRYNNAPFNAPSRESIYKRIMKLSESDDWKYDYEKFVEFDLSTHLYSGLAKLRKIQEQKEETPQDPRWVTIPQKNNEHVEPTFIKGTWRDANEKVERK